MGDEPRMLAAQSELPVVVSPDRVAGARFIEESALGTIIVLDDGMQHRRLGRDYEIVSIDCSSEAAIDAFQEGMLIPAGRFREARDPGLRRADAVILNSRMPQRIAPSTDKIEKLIPATTPVFRCFVEVRSVTEMKSGAPLPSEMTLKPFCALGNPQGFLATVATLGAEVLPAALKRDHATFSADALLRIQKENPAAALVCSAKDATKLPEDLPVSIYVVRGEATVQGKERLLASLVENLRDAKLLRS
ncbi:MAG: tetraacyldisaccharide 4'-kinase [Proteobacteria bacterium]|nr:tetraacyldisaccharide 4'-kinase [Pseudomonadota bacterium]